MSDRPTHELAADVTEATATLYRLSDELPAKYRGGAIEGVRVLVARIADLEARVTAWSKTAHTTEATAKAQRLRAEAAEAQVAALTERLEIRERQRNVAERQAYAAEAQVAALTQAMPANQVEWMLVVKEERDRAEAAEAKLAHEESQKRNLFFEREALTLALAETLDVLVERWHEWEADGRTLAEFMEMTDDEYSAFAKDGPNGYVEIIARRATTEPEQEVKPKGEQ